MEFRRFVADSVEEGLKAARQALGPRAVILETFDTDDHRVEIFAGTELEGLGNENAIDTDATTCDDIPAPVSDEPPATRASAIVQSLEAELAAVREYREKLLELSSAADLLPEELQAELFILKRSLKKELSQLADYRKRREEEESRPNPVIERLQADVGGLQETLKGELTALTQYRRERAKWHEETDPLTTDLHSTLTELQGALTDELTKLTDYRNEREAQDAELDPERSRRWTELAELQDCLASELSQLCEYRIQRAEIDAETEPRTRRLQDGLESLQTSLSAELKKLTEYRDQRQRFDAEADPMTLKLQSRLDELQQGIASELETLRDYRAERVQFNEELDPLTRTLHTRLEDLSSALSQEIAAAREYRQQRIRIDAELDPETKTLHADLGKLRASLRAMQSELGKQIETARTYQAAREQIDNDNDPRTAELQARLEALGTSLEEEISRVNAYQVQRESVDARLDPITTGLHTELTKLQGSLRAELLQLEKQRTERAAAEADLTGAIAAIRDEVSALDSHRDEMDENLSAFRNAVAEGIAQIRDVATDLKAEQSTDNLIATFREELAAFDERQAHATQELGAIRSSISDEIAQITSTVTASLTNRAPDPAVAQLQDELAAVQTAVKEEFANLRATIANEIARAVEIASMSREQSAPQPTLPDPATVRLTEELTAVQQTLKEELVHLSEYRKAQSQPAAITSPVSQMVSPLGLSADVSQALTAKMNANGAGDARNLLESLSTMFTVGSDEILTNGGVVAILGSTGVGKTTTAAKLAGQYIARHGDGKVALISTDTLRIGGAEQLATFAASMNVPLATATDPASLAEAIEDFSGYELVLIDTAGINQRDVRLADHLQALTSVPNLQNYLVISATSELTLTEEVVDAFHRIPLAGAIVTKVDEATTLGPVISGAIRHNLPIHYVCNGQAVPQDLGIARKSEIARLCKKLVLEAGVRRHAASRQARG